jgi:endonuclease/exonuclease/phosphatase family metal-dependent hydrolase
MAVPLLVICALFLVGCGAGLNPAPSDVGRAPADAPIRVMSFNIRYGTAPDGPNAWPLRRQMLVARIKAHGPDLLGTQEALAMQVDELEQLLPAYRVIGVGRDDGLRAGEFTAVFFRARRFELIESGHFWLSPKPDIFGSVGWDAALTRMATWVKLRDKLAAGRQLLFINTHWDHVGQRARMESARLVRDRIRALAGGMPVILAGDLNCDPASEAYRILLGADSAALIDAYRVIHPQPSADEATFHAFKGTAAGARIDFLLHSKDLTPVSASIDRYSEAGRYPSDHFPVVMEVEYRPR